MLKKLLRDSKDCILVTEEGKTHGSTHIARVTLNHVVASYLIALSPCELPVEEKKTRTVLSTVTILYKLTSFITFC